MSVIICATNIETPLYLLARTEADITLKPLVDSGATANFIHSRFVQRNNLPITKLEKPVSVSTIDGSSISSGKIYHKISLAFCANEKDFREDFLISNIRKRDAVLGTPFLAKHNPAIDWKNLTIEFPGEQLASIDIEGLPSEYKDFSKVFGDDFYTELPPHWPYDLAIDLKEDTVPPFGPIYPMTAAESKELREHLDENLAKGAIENSVSPRAAPVMFVKKSDRSLQLCVDYRKLNNITIKNRYPLPLQSELLEKLQGAMVFTKFNLRWGYHNV